MYSGGEGGFGGVAVIVPSDWLWLALAVISGHNGRGMFMLGWH